MDRTKAADLVAKLLRTAAPKSGASDNEREIATKQAIDLISEHELTVVVPEPKKRRERPQPPPRPYNPYAHRRGNAPGYNDSSSYYPPQRDWAPARLDKDTVCMSCGQHLWAGESVWWNAQEGYIHDDIGCAY